MVLLMLVMLPVPVKVVPAFRLVVVLLLKVISRPAGISMVPLLMKVLLESQFPFTRLMVPALVNTPYVLK